MIHTLPVLVIGGSVRPNRRSPKIAAWVAAVGRACTPLAFETVDLRAVNLTLEDEPSIPAIGPYVGEATRRWSEKVAGAGAIVFVTPQYNWGYSPYRWSIAFFSAAG